MCSILQRRRQFCWIDALGGSPLRCLSAECLADCGRGLVAHQIRSHGIEVHGVLWVIDQIHDNALGTAVALLEALRMFARDPTVRLPRRTLATYIRRYERLA